MTDCNWRQDDVYDYPDTWESDCGMSFTLMEGTPSENKMVFCCKCGNPLVEHPWKEIDND